MLKFLNDKFIKITVVVTVLGIISNLLFPLMVVNAKEPDNISFNKIEELASITTEISNKDYIDSLINNTKKL